MKVLGFSFLLEIKAVIDRVRDHKSSGRITGKNRNGDARASITRGE